jgi:hypothetical protein
LEGIKKGDIREEVEVDMAAMTFFGMLQGLVTIWSLSGFPSVPEIKKESMWKFYLDAIKKEVIKSGPKQLERGFPFSAGIEPSKLL